MKLWILLQLSLGTLAFGAAEEFLWISDVHAEARSYAHSCSYYSNTETDLRLIFKSTPVEYGTRISVVFGWEGEDASTGRHFKWSEKNEKEMTARDSMTWQVDLNQVIARRSSPITFTGLNFVFKIQEPGKSPRYQGGQNPGDTYSARLAPLDEVSCVRPDEGLPVYRELVVQIDRTRN
ncbi:hypothetical protein EBQ90_04575 [bacterium]|nr:hypothetical protein [bacterium]